MQRPQADLGSFIRVWFLFLPRLYVIQLLPLFSGGGVRDLKMILVVCAT